MGYLGGYEFQDRVAILLLINEFLKGNNSKIYIERKEDEYDKFDDVIIEDKDKTLKFQVKYSKDKEITSSMISSGDLSLYDQFLSYKSLKQENKPPIITIITNRLVNDEIFKETDEQFESLPINKLRREFIFTSKNKINKSLRKVKDSLQKEDYDEFLIFIEELNYIFVPQNVSFLFSDEGEFEREIINFLENKVGIGKYPHQNLTSMDISRSLEEQIQYLRINKSCQYVDNIFAKAGVNRIKEKFKHVFPIDEDKAIARDDLVNNIIDLLGDNNRVKIIGEPGSGKSWLVEQIVNKIDSTYLKYNFFIKVNEEFDRLRTTYEEFLLYLKYELINEGFVEEKDFKYNVSVTEEELVDVFNEKVTTEITLVFDGLDHIIRTQDKEEFYKITNFINKIENDKVKILLSSQEVDNIDKFEKIDVGYLNEDEIYEYIKHFNLEHLYKDLFKYSKGNFLYLNYLCKKYEGTNVTEIIEEYTYDGNIKGYYEYLLNGTKFHNDVLSLISSLNFEVNNKEIAEILNYKHVEDIDEIIKELKYLLHVDSCNNLKIYHESLKRYFLELEVKEKINYRQKYFPSTIEMLKNKGDFFEHRKIYKNMIYLMCEIEKYEDIYNLYSDDFIEKSIYYGYTYTFIKKNFDYFVKTARNNKNLTFLLKLSDIRKEIRNYNANINNQIDMYYLGLLRLFSEDTNFIRDLNEDFILEFGQRIKIIFMLENNIPFGADDLANIEKLEPIDLRLLSNIVEKNIGYYSDVEIDKLEYYKYVDTNSIKSHVNNQNNIMLFSKSTFKNNNDVTFNISKAREILKKEYVYGDEILKLLFYTRELSEDELKGLVSINDDYWKDRFYYVLLNTFNNNVDLNDAIILKYLQHLKIKKGDIFKGRPRSVDFHFQYKEIFFLVKFLFDNLSESQIEEGLKIITHEDDVIRYSIPRLSPRDILYYLHKVKDYKISDDIVISILNRGTDDSNITFLESSEINIEKIFYYSDGELEKALKNFSINIKSYYEHKDTSLYCLIESIQLIKNTDSKINKYYELLEMSKYVYQRTNGKETYYLERSVFELFFNEFPNEAINYLIQQIRLNRKSSELDEMILNVITNIEVLKLDKTILRILFYSLSFDESFKNIDCYSSSIDFKDDYFVKNLAYKIHKHNNYDKFYNFDNVNVFIKYLNESFPNYVDLPIFIRESNEKIKTKTYDGFVIRDDFNVRDFWREMEFKHLNVTDKETIKFIEKNITSIVEMFDLKLKSSTTYNNLKAIEKIIDNNLSDEKKFDFYLKAYMSIRGPRYEKFEYLDLFIKASEIYPDKSFEEAINYIADDVIYNDSYFKSTSNIFRLISFMNPEETNNMYDEIYNSHIILLPGFTPLEYNLNLINPVTNIIVFILEKTKLLNRESVINTLDVLHYVVENNLYQSELIESLIDFFSNYDFKHPLIYRLVLETLNVLVLEIKNKVNISNIKKSNDFTLKSYFNLNNVESFPVKSFMRHPFYIRTALLGLEQFIYYKKTIDALEDSNDRLNNLTVINGQMFDYNDRDSITKGSLIIMNDLYYSIQNLFDNDDNINLGISFEDFFRHSSFNVNDSLKQNRSKFIPLKNDEDKLESVKYILKHTRERKEFSAHINTIDDERAEMFLEDLENHFSIDGYEMLYNQDNDFIISSKTIYGKDALEKDYIEELIQIKSNELNKNELYTYDDFYEVRRKKLGIK